MYTEIGRMMFDLVAELLVGIDADDEDMKKTLFADFKVFVDGLFSIPVPLSFCKYGKALTARGKQVSVKARTSIVCRRGLY